MNKKLIILIVALECVFSVFLISIFGPMVEAIHSGVPVSEIYFTNEEGERLPDGAIIEVDLEDTRSVSLSWVILPEGATNKAVTVTADLGEDCIRISEDADGLGARITFRKTEAVHITVRATDGSTVSATVTLKPLTKPPSSDIDPFG